MRSSTSLTFHPSFLGSSPVMSCGFSLDWPWEGWSSHDVCLQPAEQPCPSSQVPSPSSQCELLTLSYFSASFSSHQKDACWGHHSVQGPLPPKTPAKPWNWIPAHVAQASDPWFKSLETQERTFEASVKTGVKSTLHLNLQMSNLSHYIVNST